MEKMNDIQLESEEFIKIPCENAKLNKSNSENNQNPLRQFFNRIKNRFSMLKTKNIILMISFLVVVAILAYFCAIYLTNTREDKSDVIRNETNVIKNETNQANSSSINNPMIPAKLNSFINHPNYHLFNAPSYGEISAEPRVGNGQEAGLKEFKWAVAIYGKNKTSLERGFWCGGTLISKNLVLTAAHCFPRDVDITGVVLGDYDTSETIDCILNDDGRKECADPTQLYSPIDFDYIIHPLYDPVNVQNDIALIKLKKPAKITQNNIKPICMPFDHENLPKNKKLTVTGFGTTEHNNGSSDVLIKGLVRVIPNEECQETYKNIAKPREINENQFCVKGDVNGDKEIDTCSGDSGSAGQIAMKNSGDINFFQFGIVSYGINKLCGEESHPSVYTKVHPYLEWILDNARF